MTTAVAPIAIPLCRADAVVMGGARGFLGSGRDPGIVVLRQGLAYVGCRNQCPHTGASLDWLPRQFLPSDRRYLQCALRGALFHFTKSPVSTR
ncbi:MAG TPA: hypothetical protein ENJ19_07545 [Gammaproteobacteria bacterium]|nr:hypothetical protein [Gammaproteobacteria bacterium]